MSNYREIRRAAHLSREKLGELAGVCGLTVQHFEEGKKVRHRTYDALVRAYEGLGRPGVAKGEPDPWTEGIRIYTSEELHMAEEFFGQPILGHTIRLRDGLKARAFRAELLKHREDCAARRRKIKLEGGIS